jgi:hypothetical protein
LSRTMRGFITGPNTSLAWHTRLEALISFMSRRIKREKNKVNCNLWNVGCKRRTSSCRRHSTQLTSIVKETVSCRTWHLDRIWIRSNWLSCWLERRSNSFLSARSSEKDSRLAMMWLPRQCYSQ